VAKVMQNAGGEVLEGDDRLVVFGGEHVVFRT
jgi:hypothetical protein